MSHKERMLHLPTIIFGSLVIALAIWVGGYQLIVHSVETNLWSIQYLWQQEDHALGFLPILATEPPSNHHSALLWQIRDLIQDGQLIHAQTLLAPLVSTGDQDVLRLQANLFMARNDLVATLQLLSTFGAVDELLDFGQLAQEEGQLDLAFQAYRTAYDVNAERAVLPLARLLWREQDNRSDAEQLLRHYIASMPNSRYFTRWLQELGALYQSNAEWASAITIFEQLIKIEPDNIGARIQLGWTYYNRGDGLDAALIPFQQAIAIAPDEGEGYFAVATLLSREKRYTEADPWFVQAVEKAPDHQWWWETRAATLQKAGDLTKVAQIYAIIEQRFPNSASGHFAAAQVYRQVEKRAAAISAIETALSLIDITDTKQQAINASYYARAGEIYEWVGAVQKAVAAYEQAQQLDATRPDVAAGLQRLIGN